MTEKSKLERAFLTYWKQEAPDYPEPEQQYKFHPDRKWRLDFAWPECGKVIGTYSPEGRAGSDDIYTSPVAVEVHGGTWTGGRHVRGQGFRNDREKMNAAISLGWRVFEYTTGMLDDDPKGCIDPVKEALDG